MEDVGETERPRWLEKPTVGYIQQVLNPLFLILCHKLLNQQVIMKAAVHPYTEDLLRNDAFRGPLATSFKLGSLAT